MGNYSLSTSSHWRNMNRLVLFLIVFLSVNPLIAENESVFKSVNDSISTREIAMIEANYQTQFNSLRYRYEVNLFSLSYKLKKIPFYIGSDLIRISGVKQKNFKKVSLNSYANLGLLLGIGSLMLPEESPLTTIIIIPPMLCLLPNALTNLQLEFEPMRNGILNFFAGTNGDFFLIKEKIDFCYSYNCGISLMLGRNSLSCLKIYYSNDLRSLKYQKKMESIGLSFGMRIDFDAAMSI